METYEFMKTMGKRTNRVNQIYSDWARAYGINYNILSVLYTAYKNDKCSQKYICEQWCIPKQTVSTTCKDLMERGIITQAQNAEDKRASDLSLTEKGRKFAEPIVGELLNIESRVLDRMGKENVMKFFDLYRIYVEDIEIEFQIQQIRAVNKRRNGNAKNDN